jgi:hypothetical protein
METIKDVYIMLPGKLENDIPVVHKVDIKIVRIVGNDNKYAIANYELDGKIYEITYYLDKPFFTTHAYVINGDTISKLNHQINLYTSKDLMLSNYERILNSIESLLLNKQIELEESIKAIRKQKELLYTKGENLFK